MTPDELACLIELTTDAWGWQPTELEQRVLTRLAPRLTLMFGDPVTLPGSIDELDHLEAAAQYLGLLPVELWQFADAPQRVVLLDHLPVCDLCGEEATADGTIEGGGGRRGWLCSNCWAARGCKDGDAVCQLLITPAHALVDHTIRQLFEAADQ